MRRAEDVTATLAALVLAVFVLVAARRLLAVRARVFVACACASAAALSAAYVAWYLRGGPRIIDATTYFLEARALAEGFFVFPLGEPPASTMGRFLVRPPGDAAHAAAIFPPGYPAVLAIGFLAHVPLAVGPVLGALVTAVTWWLARGVARSATESARFAVLFSVVCAALRYHTADTMSHGLAAVCFAGSLAAAFGATDADGWDPMEQTMEPPSPRRARARRLGLAGVAGACAGWLAATRPTTAGALVATLAFAVAVGAVRATPGALVVAALAAVPGVALLLAHQHAATGAFFASSQRAYYAASDGPPGCFTYGFGAGIGCVGEHGTFVDAHLARGFGAVAALGTTLRRLRAHLVDAGNAEPMIVVVVAGAVAAWRAAPRVRVLAFAVGAQIVAYAPFYFDGNYPGGGARMYADVLPLEHVLAGLGAAALGAAAAARGWDAARAAAAPVALALAGFALRGTGEHAALRDREGGRPMFDAGVLERAGVKSGLVYLDTDHGFDLAFDPAPVEAASRPSFVRARGDDLDRLAWDARGRPPAFRYAYDFATGSASATPIAFEREPSDSLRVAGGSLWPALEQRRAFALVDGGSAARLAMYAAQAGSGTGRPRVVLDLPHGFAGRSISPCVARWSGRAAEIELVADGYPAGSSTVPASAAASTCVNLPVLRAPSNARTLHLVATLTMGASSAGATSPELTLDRLDAAP